MLRSRHTVPLLILLIVIGAASAAVALLIDWLPDQASEQAERVDLLLWFVVWVSLALFTIVMAVLIYSIWRFRVPEDDDEDGPPTHGNTQLEIIWTIIPAVLLAVVAVWAYIVLADNEALAAQEDRITIDVTAEQFAWTFSYPDDNIASGDLRVPVDKQIVLKMRAKDVIHDFYVIEWKVKEDVVPGITTDLIIDPNETGTFQVVCAELCGVGHGVMRTRVIVMEPGDYASWLASAKQQVAREAAAANAGSGDQGGTTTTGETP
ncbi:MAG: cytochrome c oxidase subunit II [Thermoleophilia bacterium]